MEFLPGSFEREWERRRAMLMHEMQLGQIKKSDWEEPRRGGVARLGDEGSGGFGGAPRRQGGGGASWSRGGTASGRPMRTRFAALARGSQPAVVKLASYGGGARAGAMMSYTSRDGELAVENERGERVLGKDALAGQRAEWEHLFDNRAASRDFGVFHVSVDTASLSGDVDQDDQVRQILRLGFGDRRFVYTLQERSSGEFYISGVVVLRDGSGERLTGDRKAAEIVQQRFDASDSGRHVETWFRFHGYGNGVEWGTVRVRELVAGTEGEVRDDTGRLIGDAAQAGDLVQREWRKELHSRRGRDVMHLIVSARAGTDGPAFEGAVREFLGEQFAGHRYVFAVHDPALDPKEMAEGGKRPHIHAHAIVTMRSDTGERIVTSPQTFRDWRSMMAEKAREQGIDMELTDRREFANAPAYTRNQVRPVDYRERTEHEGTSPAAHARYEAKRFNDINVAATDRSRQYAATAAEVWKELANDEQVTGAGAFAMQQAARLDDFSEINQTDCIIADSGQSIIKNATNMIGLVTFVNGEDGQMQEMTRPEFEAYENRVEAVLASVEQTLDATDRADFNEVAAVAREVVDIRREYLEVTERQHDHRGDQYENGDSQYMREAAKSNQDLQRTIEQIELPQAEDRRDERHPGRNQDADMAGSRTNSQSEGATDEMRGAAEAEQRRDAVRDGGSAPEQEDHFVEQLAAESSEKRTRYHDERAAERKPALDAELARSDPPQQHVPRLRQIEFELEEQQDRDRDDRER